ncbi:MAG TPA: retention module-containing protein, partial [Burkholderiales bacterium]|nr:retention module-containing protein [Burkholderiales bacterium]
MAATGKVIGTVTSVVGEAKATAADGSVRVLQVGDLVHSDEVITTSAGGAINIALENGRSLDCSGDTSLALHESILGVATAVTAPAASPAPGTPGSDVAALQAAIQSGQDPSQVAPATAAGGAPAAGGAGDGGGGTAVILEQANTAGVVSSGFPTAGDTIAFPLPEFELLPTEEEPPAVSVSVQVQVQVQVEVEVDVSIEPNIVDGPPEGGVFAVSASGDAVSLVEGTAEGT